MISWRVLQGDCVERMRELPDASIDAVVTDPPYHLAFMGKAWDHAPTPRESQREHERWAHEAHRVLKPGGHLLAFGGTRTYHRLAAGIEDAGFEIRDTIAWMYGQGFAKSWNFDTQYDGEWCQCKPLPYSRAGDADVHGVREGVSAATEPRRAGEGTDVLAGVQRGEPGPGLGDARAQGPGGLVGGDRAGVPGEDSGPGEDAGAPEGAAERVRPGAPARGRADAGSSAGAGRGGPSPERGPGGQPPGEPAGVRDPSRALDDRALRDGGRCPRCGGLSREFRGHGTALKPGHEPIIVARKPLSGTVAQTVLEHGTGALNIDGCRVAGPPRTTSAPDGRWPANVVLDEETARMLDEQAGERPSAGRYLDPEVGSNRRAHARTSWNIRDDAYTNDYAGETGGPSRFFATFKHAEEPCPVSLSPSASVGTGGATELPAPVPSGETGTPERFRYVAKASSAERNAGLNGFEEQRSGTGALRAEQGGEYMEFVHDVHGEARAWIHERRYAAGFSSSFDLTELITGKRTGTVANWESGVSRPTVEQWTKFRSLVPSDDRYDDVMTAQRVVVHATRDETVATKRNVHPTVKPVELMRWLVRLVTPPGGTVLDPFLGSGTTGAAAMLEPCVGEFIGIERDPEYVPIAEARIKWWAEHPDGMKLVERLEHEAERKTREDAGQTSLFA